jgi:hypothetical protein
MCAMRTDSLPSDKRFWGEIVPRIESAVQDRQEELAQLIGIYREFGPKGKGFTGESEIDQCMAELVKFLVLAICYQLEARERASQSGLGLPVGRPRNHMIRYLGPQIVAIFHRYSDTGGRHSVWTFSDGRLTQEETGPLFTFASLMVAVFNEIVAEELRLPPLSAARVIRNGLAERRRQFYAPEYGL